MTYGASVYSSHVYSDDGVAASTVLFCGPSTVLWHEDTEVTVLSPASVVSSEITFRNHGAPWTTSTAVGGRTLASASGLQFVTTGTVGSYARADSALIYSSVRATAQGQFQIGDRFGFYIDASNYFEAEMQNGFQLMRTSIAGAVSTAAWPTRSTNMTLIRYGRRIALEIDGKVRGQLDRFDASSAGKLYFVHAGLGTRSILSTVSLKPGLAVDGILLDTVEAVSVNAVKGTVRERESHRLGTAEVAIFDENTALTDASAVTFSAASFTSVATSLTAPRV